MHRYPDRFFGKAEEINGNKMCETYLFRWTVFTVLGVSGYLHKFVDDDWSTDMHDHPRIFISFGLWGSYIEQTPGKNRTYAAPWVRIFPAAHIHRLMLPIDRKTGKKKVCWTFVIVLRKTRKWGFWVYSKGGYSWIHSMKYVRGPLGKEGLRKDC